MLFHSYGHYETSRNARTHGKAYVSSPWGTPSGTEPHDSGRNGRWADTRACPRRWRSRRAASASRIRQRQGAQSHSKVAPRVETGAARKSERALLGCSSLTADKGKAPFAARGGSMSPVEEEQRSKAIPAYCRIFLLLRLLLMPSAIRDDSRKNPVTEKPLTYSCLHRCTTQHHLLMNSLRARRGCALSPACGSADRTPRHHSFSFPDHAPVLAATRARSQSVTRPASVRFQPISAILIYTMALSSPFSLNGLWLTGHSSRPSCAAACRCFEHAAVCQEN